MQKYDWLIMAAPQYRRMIIPAGYLTLVDAIDAVVTFWSDDSFGQYERSHDEAIERVVSLLGTESIKSVGWHFESGNLLPLPPSLFRSTKGVELVSHRKLTSVINGSNGSACYVIPIIDSYQLADVFKGFLISKQPKFDPQIWDLTSPTDDIIPATAGRSILSTFPIEPQGRKPKHNWDDFWIEAIMYAHLHSLDEFEDFRKEMKNFIAKHQDTAAHKTQVNTKLSQIRDAWLREKSNSKK
jgi:hypothetical protein